MRGSGSSVKTRVGLVIALASFFLCLWLSACSQPREVTILAAASTKEPLSEAVKIYQLRHPEVKLYLSFGGSGALAAQLVEGAKADLFLSASEASAEKLIAAGKADAVYELLNNQLVMIQSADFELTLMSEQGLLSEAVRHVAMGEPESVPAGEYAKKVLTDLKLYEPLKEKIVFGKDVKEVLNWVATGEAQVGFVYLTDAIAEPNVSILRHYSVAETGKISYQLVQIGESPSRATQDFSTWLKGDEAMKLFLRYGFEPGGDQ